MTKQEIKEVEAFVKDTGFDLIGMIRIFRSGKLPVFSKDGRVHDDIKNAHPVAGRFWQQMTALVNNVTTEPPKETEEATFEPDQEVDVNLSFAERCAKWSNECEVGDFIYPGGLITDQVQEDIQAAGVVGWRNPDPNAPVGQRGLMVCRLQVSKVWSKHTKLTGIADLADGWSNTQALLKLGKEKSWSFPAAEWCTAYAEGCVKPGEGFLAAKEQLKKIFANTDAINASLAKIGAEKLAGWYWSSSEYGNGYAWIVYTNGNVDWSIKNNYSSQYVRCVLAF